MYHFANQNQSGNLVRFSLDNNHWIAFSFKDDKSGEKLFYFDKPYAVDADEAMTSRCH